MVVLMLENWIGFGPLILRIGNLLLTAGSHCMDLGRKKVAKTNGREKVSSVMGVILTDGGEYHRRRTGKR